MRRPIASALMIGWVHVSASAASAQRFFYPAPPEAFRVRTDVVFATADTGLRRMDVYQPATGSQTSPALIFFSRARASDEWIKGWARVAAANGIVGVIPDLHDLQGDALGDALRRVVSHLSDRAAPYGVDRERVAVFAGSAGVTSILPAVEDSTQTAIKAAVMYYGTANVTTFRRDLPLLYVSAGLDHPEMNAGIMKAASLAIAQDAPITLLNHHLGHHNFEIIDDDIATRHVIEQTIEFVKHATMPEYQALLRDRRADAIAAGYLGLGDYHNAAVAFAELVKRKPADGLLRFRYAAALSGDDQFGAACAVYRSFERNFAAVVPGSRACVRAGSIDSTVAWLQRMPAGWVRSQAEVFKSDTVFAPLLKRGDFQALLVP